MSITIDDVLRGVNGDPKAKEACFRQCYKSGFYGTMPRNDARQQFEVELINDNPRRQVIMNHFMPHYERYLNKSYKEKKAWFTAGLSLIATIAGCLVRDPDISSVICTAGLAGLVPSSLLGCYYNLTKL